jgi:hypothetical protein
LYSLKIANAAPIAKVATKTEGEKNSEKKQRKQCSIKGSGAIKKFDG